ncbi:hypothetical protein [Ferrimonas pelagia]|uniref:Uncharacterized protein n=1 Tax=Ferrimonas pelagia TaxID=1177826 RepID=A0ABP9EIX1_9GAMM
MSVNYGVVIAGVLLLLVGCGGGGGSDSPSPPAPAPAPEAVADEEEEGQEEQEEAEPQGTTADLNASSALRFNEDRVFQVDVEFGEAGTVWILSQDDEGGIDRSAPLAVGALQGSPFSATVRVAPTVASVRLELWFADPLRPPLQQQFVVDGADMSWRP